jgi:predicted O-methyltransferase YrrM
MPAAGDRRGLLGGARHAWGEGGPSLLASRARQRGAEAFENASQAVAAAGAARAVRRARPQTIDAAMEFAANFKFARLGIAPMQIESELRALLNVLAQEPPRAVVEIGTGRGGTLFLFATVADPDAVLVSVDAAANVFGGRSLFKRRTRLYRALGRRSQKVTFVGGDSHADETRQRVDDALAGRPVDFLFIDGDHSREGVEGDFAMYSPLVREGGIVAFHDIVPGPEEFVGGVPEFWKRIRDSSSSELVEDWGQGGCGIGVLRL